MRRQDPLPPPAERPGATTGLLAGRSARRLAGLLAGLLALASIPFTVPPAQARQAPEAGTPPEVAAFVERRAACRRWDEEGGTEPERAAETARERFRLKCATLASDERRLRARYATSPDALEALGEAGDD